MDWQGHYAFFTAEEMQCKCGCEALPQHELMVCLDALRAGSGVPMIISSGARCAHHNAAVSTSGPNGPHVLGLAADVQVYGVRAYLLIQLAIALGFEGVGVNQKGPAQKRYLHLDIVKPGTAGFNRPWLWSY